MNLIDELCCQSFCSHGGICSREPGHASLHASPCCIWPDAESLTRAEADAVICLTAGAAALEELERAEQLLEAWYRKRKGENE